jgi:hypothetical protein
LDFQRAVESVMMTTPGASVHAFAQANRKYGPDNEAALIWPRMDSKVQLLTPNTTVIYVFMWMDLKKGPLVMEVPHKVMGIVDDHWFKYVADFGMAGPDKGKGGKYLFLPPDYKGETPEGYFISQSATYGKGSLKNNFTFSHPSFRLHLAAAQSRSPQNSSLFLWLRSIAATKSDLNLSANSANLFLSEP